MNKQEFQQTIKNMKYKKDCVYMSSFEVFLKGFEKAKELALLHSNSLDEPEKPKVPQVAVEFYERYKDDNLALGEWFGDFYSPEAIEEFPRMDELTKWLHDNNDETNRQRELALATLVTLGIDAVEVEKEKLYTVEIPNPNDVERPILYKNRDGKVSIIFPSVPCWREVKNAQLTESEIKLEHEWAWEFAEEVEEWSTE